MWQYGDRHYHAKRWSEAADWFLAGAHAFFQSSLPSGVPKCFRKAALCYIEQREYAKATTVIRRCSTDEAANYYVTFVAAMYQGPLAILFEHLSCSTNIPYLGLEDEGKAALL